MAHFPQPSSLCHSWCDQLKIVCKMKHCSSDQSRWPPRANRTTMIGAILAQFCLVVMVHPKRNQYRLASIGHGQSSCRHHRTQHSCTPLINSLVNLFLVQHCSSTANKVITGNWNGTVVCSHFGLSLHSLWFTLAIWWPFPWQCGVLQWPNLTLPCDTFHCVNVRWTVRANKHIQTNASNDQSKAWLDNFQPFETPIPFRSQQPPRLRIRMQATKLWTNWVKAHAPNKPFSESLLS